MLIDCWQTNLCRKLKVDKTIFKKNKSNSLKRKKGEIYYEKNEGKCKKNRIYTFII